MNARKLRYAEAMLRRAFTLTELMITVALVGVLAAIGITSWRDTQFRTLRAEIPPNVEAIRVAELAYFATWDTFVEETVWYPGDLALDATDKLAVEWPEVGTAGGFDTIGWQPFAKVRGRYSIPVGDETSLQVEGTSNVDGDSEAASYFATEQNTGTWDTGSANEF